MHLMHRVLGDDLLRELLMHAVVLIPLGETPGPVSSHGELHNDKIRFRNYFQLCGRPLFLENKTIDRDMKQNMSINSSVLGAAETNLITRSHNHQTRYAWDPHEAIPRFQVFYSESFNPKIGFPPSHILNNANANESKGHTRAASKQLLESMLQISANPMKRGKKRRINVVRLHGEKICQEILKNHAKCDYARLLERYCPLSNVKSRMRLSQNADNSKLSSTSILHEDDPQVSETTLRSLLSSYCSSHSVGSFIKAVISRLFPLGFWGSKENLNVFLETLMRFMALRRGETFTMKMILHGIHVTDMNWLYMPVDCEKRGPKRRKVCRKSHEAICYSVRNVLKWMYCKIIIPLLRSSFYITDTQISTSVAFYRKPVWSKIKSLALKQLQDSQQYKSISYDQGLRQLAVSKLGASKLRLLPKSSGLRPIANLAKSYRLKAPKNYQIIGSMKKMLCVNAILRKALDVLKYEFSLRPNSFGCGIDYDKIRSKYIKFMTEVREMSGVSTRSADRDIFFASVDINQCFDNIKQDIMHTILEGFINEVRISL